MFWIYLFLFLQLGLSSMAATDLAVESPAMESKNVDNPKNDEEKASTDSNLCLENCRKTARELPACHDAACKKENQAKIKKCRSDCQDQSNPSAKAEEIPPCVMICIDLAKLSQGQCAGSAPCLQNVESQAHDCAQQCYQEAVAKGEA